MSSKLKGILPWFIPAAAIVFAGSGYLTVSQDGPSDVPEAPDRAQARAPAPVVLTADQERIAALEAELQASRLQAVAAQSVSEDEVVARQASPSVDLSSVQPASPVAQPVTAERPPEPAALPEPAVDDRQAALTVPHGAARAFASGQAALEDSARCLDDLQNLTRQAIVYFPNGGVTADDSGIEQARLIGLVAQSCEGVQIRVQGHSDASGDLEANLRLSQQRAEAVIQRIAASGVDTSVFFAEGAGSRIPSSVEGPQPRAFYDRRVEFAVTDNVTRVAVRAPQSAAPQVQASCVDDLEQAAAAMSFSYAPRSVSLPGQDLDQAMELAKLATACPDARLRIVGHHSGAVQDREDVRTGLLRAKALMAMMVGRGLSPDQLIIAAPSRAMTDDGSTGSRVNFDVAIDQE